MRKGDYFRCNNEKEEVYEVFAYPILDKSNEPLGVVEYSRDVTEANWLKTQRELEVTNRQLAVEKKAAEVASQAKSQFLANMSHELRTPLNGVMGMIQLMQSTELDEEQKEFMKYAMDASHTLTNVVGEILNYTSLEQNKSTKRSDPFKLDNLLSDVVAMYQAAAAHKGLSISLEKQENVPTHLVGDQFKIRQVLGILLGNAVKFTDQGAVKINVGMAEDRDSTGEMKLEFRVTDTGIGIAPDKLDYIFKPFAQADESHTREHGGLGLGLSVALEQSAILGGTLRAESHLDQGSTFIFTCCVAINHQYEETPTPQPGDILMPPRKKPSLRVLVVDDDEASRMVEAGMLKKMGCAVDQATDGAEAMERVANQKYDLILMDCQMPLMDGYEATRRIRELEKTTGDRHKIVALTAKVLPGDREKCLEAGMDGFLAKPIEKNQLENLVERKSQ